MTFCNGNDSLRWWVEFTSVLTFAITAIGAIVGIVGYTRYRCEFHRKSKRLEEYLRAEKQKEKDQGQRSILRIVSDVGLTEDEIIKISFHNKKIRRRVAADPDTKLANVLLFEYQEE